MLRRFWDDESGFLIAGELVLIFTIMVLGLVVGMAEIQWAITGELDDVGDAFGSLNQSFSFCGFSVLKSEQRESERIVVFGSFFFDFVEECDRNQCMLGCDAPVPEGPKP